MEEKKAQAKVKQDVVHNLILENRKKLSVSGIEEVESFNEEEIVLRSMRHGVIVIKGSQLHINRLNVDSGDVNIAGTVLSIEYIDESAKVKGPGLIARLFK